MAAELARMPVASEAPRLEDFVKIGGCGAGSEPGGDQRAAEPDPDHWKVFRYAITFSRWSSFFSLGPVILVPGT